VTVVFYDNYSESEYFDLNNKESGSIVSGMQLETENLHIQDGKCMFLLKE
jgi:hypothetical protein